ncbi:MAG: hypothetical protein KJ571_06175 [Bacteroidetes bacterium]|nr:hypothetical protein [Bacteroidota bacterium]
MKDKRLKNLEKSIEKLSRIEKNINRKSGRTGIIRAVLFFSVIILFPVSYLNFSLVTSSIILIPVFAGFVLVSIQQVKLLKYLKSIRSWIKIKKSFISRINLDWDNIEIKNLPDNIKQNLIETDLDLTGERSLHQLIDFSISTEGSLLLREFLTNHNLSQNEILKKQNLVKEILSLNRFREKFLLTLSLVSKNRIDANKIISWMDKNSGVISYKWILFITSSLAIINLVMISLAIAGILNGVWILSGFIYVSVYMLSNKYYKGIDGDSLILQEELGKFSRILEFIENYKFNNSQNLKTLCETIQNKKNSPSLLLKRINRIVTILTFRANQLIWGFFALIFPIDFYLAYFLQKYKQIISKNFKSWLYVWHNLEAYVSISTFAYLNPGYNFPEISKDKFEFKAEELGHPLIKYISSIKNNFKINGMGEAFIITGSNMSGKSTFLRTLGINICLAYAGAPVNSNSFRMSPLKLFTCIKVSDSVIDGISYFYSEVKRLKELLVLIDNNKNEPVFYLIDEIFKGTNNIERRIGSSSFIKSLTGKNCAGLISTHDIELVKLADENKFILNYHFKEEVKKDKMIFDYKLREGPCPTTNALKIMEIEGLPVEK